MDKNCKLEIEELVQHVTTLQMVSRSFVDITWLKEYQVFDDERELQEAGKVAEALGNLSEKITELARKLALRIRMEELENLRRVG